MYQSAPRHPVQVAKLNSLKVFQNFPHTILVYKQIMRCQISRSLLSITDKRGIQYDY